MATNATLGKLLLALTLSVFAYYTFWVAVLPFMVIDSYAERWIYSLFPPMKYAFLIPVSFGVVLVGGLSLFTLYLWCAHIRSVP